MSSPRWHDVIDVDALQRAASSRILEAAARAIQERGRFRIVLAGGQTPRGVYQMLRTANAAWNDWQIHFSDERCLPREDAERNSRMTGLAWLDHVPIPAAQVHTIPAELGAERAAAVYATDLQGVGDFDLVLLGLGEDGHTAGLFPGHDWGDAPGAPEALAVFDAPKPPPQRVSLSAMRLSRSREVLFLVAGPSKHAAVARWRAGECPECNLPLTARGAVDMVITELAVFSFDPGSLTLVELMPGASLEQVRATTSARFVERLA